MPLLLCLFGGWHTTAAVLYVDVHSANPLPPFSSWPTAATNIQDAVDAATNGDQVFVTNGIYQTGGRPLPGSVLTNRVLVTNTITVRSVNGPATAVILGFLEPGSLSGTNNVRCAYLDGGAQLVGFTLTNGATTVNPYADGPFSDRAGGGVFCASTNEVLSNCVISGNMGLLVGGGAYSGALNHCTLTGNSAGFGGGAVYSTLNECLLTSNLAENGGGTFASVLYNCTVAGNSATSAGGGVYSGFPSYTFLYNCIVQGNSARTAPNYDSNCTLAYCCAVPLAPGDGNITNNPLFVNPVTGDFHLQSNSPCINAGDNAYLTNNATDLDGNPRISGGTVDIGAYEFQNPASIISYAWLQQYGLPTDGSADFIDSDHNGMNNWQKWIAGLDPTNPSSVLQMLSPTTTTNPPGLVVTWQSVPNHNYYLQRATNLMLQPAFQPLAANLPGQAGTTSFTDTNAPAPGPYFYRIGVQQ